MSQKVSNQESTPIITREGKKQLFAMGLMGCICIGVGYYLGGGFSKDKEKAKYYDAIKKHCIVYEPQKTIGIFGKDTLTIVGKPGETDKARARFVEENIPDIVRRDLLVDDTNPEQKKQFQQDPNSFLKPSGY